MYARERSREGKQCVAVTQGGGMPRDERKAANQALFRDVNERIAELAAGLDPAGSEQAFICECSHVGCTASVQIPASAYAQVREDATTFLLIPGHEDPSRADILVRFPNYLIVRNKEGVAADIAPETA